MTKPNSTINTFDLTYRTGAVIAALYEKIPKEK
jgi:hypothetical protein